MDIGTILGWLVVAFLLRLVIGFTMKSWRHRNDGPAHEVDLAEVGHRGSWSGGDFEPDTIERIERLAKEEAEKEHSD